MIRFADKEVYNIHLGDMTRLQMLLFFLKNDEQRRAVIFVYDEYDCYYGMVSYRSVLYNEEIEDCIIKDIFTSIAPSKVEEYSDTEKLWLAEKIDMAYFYLHNDSYSNKHEIIKKYFGTKLYDLIMSGQLDEKKIMEMHMGLCRK